MSTTSSRRVVITGVGLISPLGNSPEDLWDGMSQRRSGVGLIQSLPRGSLPICSGAEARQFTGEIEQYGPLDKPLQKLIRKGQKLMCREIEMGVAAAQLALHNAGLTAEHRNPHRTGVVFGSDYIMTLPDEYIEGIRECTGPDGTFRFDNWAERGLPKVNPLWLLKYLPNMPASHIAIYNDLQGPNNSLTLREASSCAAIAEAYCILARGHADALVVGGTGTRIHPFRSLHAVTQEMLAPDREDPTKMSRPFDRDRNGAVLGEGAAALILEDLGTAQARNARIWGEVIGFASAAVGPKEGLDFPKKAVRNVANQALRRTARADIGHINAHGLSTYDGDRFEAEAYAEIFGNGNQMPPVVAAKSYFGNLGAASGMVEIIASLLALQHDRLFATLNFENADPCCPVKPVVDADVSPGDSFLKVNVTPQGQAAAVVIRRFVG